MVSPWLFNIYMDVVMKEMKMRTREDGTEMTLNNKVWKMCTCLYAEPDDAVLFTESEQELQSMVKI